MGIQQILQRLSWQKLVLYILDYIGIVMSIILILNELYTYLSKWKLFDQDMSMDVLYASLDQALYKGFSLLIISSLLLAYLIGWRQKELSMGTIILGVFMLIAFPMPKLAGVIILGGVVGFLLTPILDIIQK